MRVYWLVLAMAAAAAFGQPSNVTDDGGQYYFVSDLRLKADRDRPQTSGRQTATIYRYADGKVEGVVYPSAGRILSSPRVSGAGDIVTYLSSVESCATQMPCFREWIVARKGKPDIRLATEPVMSRNGRFLAQSADGSTTLLDLTTGESTPVPLQGAAWVSNRGTVYRVISASGAIAPQRWRAGGEVETLPVPTVPSGSYGIFHAVDEMETWILYSHQSVGPGGAPPGVRSMHIPTGRIFDLPPRVYRNVSLTLDGTIVYSGERDGLSQAFAMQPDGTNVRPLTNHPGGFESPQVSGDGKVVYGYSGGSLLRFDAPAGTYTKIFGPAPPRYSVLLLALAAGGVYSIHGERLAPAAKAAPEPLPLELDGVRVLWGGQPLPIAGIAPGEVRFQVPWELAAKDGESGYLEIASDSIFDTGGANLGVKRRSEEFYRHDLNSLIAAHEDFRGLVTQGDPARPGQIIHLWAKGLGDVDRPVPTGVTTPAGLVSPIQARLACQLFGLPVEVLYAGLAPGMLGIYQVSVRIPEIPATGATAAWLRCGVPGDEPSQSPPPAGQIFLGRN